MAAGEGRHRRASMVRERGKEEEEMEKKRKREKGEPAGDGKKKWRRKGRGKKGAVSEERRGFLGFVIYIYIFNNI